MGRKEFPKGGAPRKEVTSLWCYLQGLDFHDRDGGRRRSRQSNRGNCIIASTTDDLKWACQCGNDVDVDVCRSKESPGTDADAMIQRWLKRPASLFSGSRAIFTMRTKRGEAMYDGHISKRIGTNRTHLTPSVSHGVNCLSLSEDRCYSYRRLLLSHALTSH